jgi:hemerythrin superfamily protein
VKATQLLKTDHATVKTLFSRFRRTGERAEKARQALIDRIATELEIHAQIEEEIFYPAMRQVRKAASLLREAHKEHEQVKKLVAEMQSAEDDEIAGTVQELRDAVLHHATEEEREMFPLAKELGAEKLDELGAELRDRKQALKKGLLARAKRGAKKAIRKAA